MAVMTSAPNLSPENSTNVRPANASVRRSQDGVAGPGSLRVPRAQRAMLNAIRAGLRVAEVLPGGVAAAWSERLFTTPKRHERPARERALLERATPLRFFAGEQMLHGWRWGEGPAVLLVHGW